MAGPPRSGMGGKRVANARCEAVRSFSHIRPLAQEAEAQEAIAALAESRARREAKACMIHEIKRQRAGIGRASTPKNR